MAELIIKQNAIVVGPASVLCWWRMEANNIAEPGAAEIIGDPHNHFIYEAIYNQRWKKRKTTFIGQHQYQMIISHTNSVSTFSALTNIKYQSDTADNGYRFDQGRSQGGEDMGVRTPPWAQIFW